jgi:hypothetical protein
MKKAFGLGLIILVFYACTENKNKVDNLKDSDSACIFKDTLNYNPTKDSLINALLEQKEFTYERNKDRFSIIYTEYKIIIVYKEGVKFKSKEVWEYYCTDIEGNEIYIYPKMEPNNFYGYDYIEYNSIKPETYIKIQELYKKLNPKSHPVVVSRRNVVDTNFNQQVAETHGDNSPIIQGNYNFIKY